MKVGDIITVAAASQDSPMYIYGLRCPIDGRIRYVGKSCNPMRRLLGHIINSKLYSDQIVCEWIYGLIQQGINPTMEILEIATNSGAHKAERRWMDKLQREGCDLYNNDSTFRKTHGLAPKRAKGITYS